MLERRLRNSLAQFALRKDATAAVEIAMLLPVMMLLLFGIMECAMAVWTQTSLQGSVEMAARCAVVDSTNCGTDSDVKTYGSLHAAGLIIDSSNYTVSSQTCGKQVSVSYPFTSMVPNLVPLSFTLSAQYCHPV